jgi:hypothetical protein
VPVGARYELASRNARYAVGHIKIVSLPQKVRYDVTVIPAAAIVGHLVGQNGKPLNYYSVLAERIPWTNSCRAIGCNVYNEPAWSISADRPAARNISHQHNIFNIRSIWA